MKEIKVLWADDEIDLLKPHILFLEEKGYQIDTVNNGFDALEMIKNTSYNAVLLDEQMPGYSGLDTLNELKHISPSMPVIMITKSEEEMIMEEAIGAKISDYLIKPVNPNQILLSLKKNLDTQRLVKEKSTQNYQKEFRNLSLKLNGPLDIFGWMDVFKDLTYWDIELAETSNDMREILNAQKREANAVFSKFVEKNYTDWLSDSTQAPLMSHTLLTQKLFKENTTSKGDFLIVIDNLRFDQWVVLKPLFEKYFKVDEQGLYLSILPTATHYARNALFAGLLPSEIEKIYPDLWLSEEDQGSKNKHEQDLFERLIKRNGKNWKTSYHKVLNSSFGKKVNDSFNNLMHNDLNIVVYNFVDMLSHAATDTKLIKELAEDESAYRSVVESWFKHSNLKQLLEKISSENKKVFLTTDHGTIYVQRPSKVIGDRNTNTNLRYKVGKNLSYQDKEVLTLHKPTQEGYLPKSNVSSKYIFAKEDYFFAYPNNYNHYVNYYKNTFQHGGISLEEMLIPYVKLS